MTILVSVLFWLSLVVVLPVVLWLTLVSVFSAGLWVTLKVSPLTVLLAGPLLQPFSDTWSVGGIWIDSLDLVLAGLTVVLLLRRRRYRRAPIPYFRLWLLLGIVTSVAYVCAPINGEYLTDPVRLAYQLYRYCWKPILYYPLTALLVTDRRGFASVLFVAVAVADIFSIQATVAGYTGGMRASGPFGYGSNALGSALILPLMVALARFAETAGRQRWFYGASTLLILRGVIFTGSRGAAMGALCGGALLVWGLRRTVWGRNHLRRLAKVLLCVVALVAVSRGNPLDRPSLQRFMVSDSEESTDTLRWRLEERWPHFWKKVKENPLLGVGTDSDLVFGKVGNTPHNGFLSIAVTSGLPALAIFLLLTLAAVHAGRRAFQKNPRTWQGVTGLAAAAGVVSVLVHNLVDTTMTVAFVAQMFWMLAAIAARMGREPAEVTVVVTPARTEVAKVVPLRSARPA